MPITNVDLEGSLSIGGIAMNNVHGAWGITGDEEGRGGLIHLWAGFDVRGDDRILPGSPGVIAYPRRVTRTRHDLRFLVTGDIIGQTGATPADARVGLATNFEYLRANVLAPVVSSTGTRAATLTMPDGSTRTANIHVLGMVVQSYMLMDCASIAVTTLQISIPAGRFS